MDYFGSKPQKSLSPELCLDSMTRECARPYSQWTYLVDADAIGNLGAKLNFIFPAPTTCPKTRSRATEGTVPLADALHLRQFLTFLCPSAGYPHYATLLLVVNRKI